MCLLNASNGFYVACAVADIICHTINCASVPIMRLHLFTVLSTFMYLFASSVSSSKLLPLFLQILTRGLFSFCQA